MSEPANPLLPLTRAEAISFLQLEMDLIERRFEKLDGLVAQLRGWLVTAVTAVVGLAVASRSLHVLALAFYPLAFFFGIELDWKRRAARVTSRYVYVRDAFTRGGDFGEYRPGDLTNHHLRPPGGARMTRNTRRELFWFYGAFLATLLALYALAAWGRLGEGWSGAGRLLPW